MADIDETPGTRHFAQQQVDTMKGATEAAKETASRSFDTGAYAVVAATATTAELIDRGRDALGRGFMAAERAASGFAHEASEDGRRLADEGGEAAHLYRQAANDAAEDVRALGTSYMQFGQGLIRMHQAYLDAVERSLASAKRQPQDLLRCTSLTQLAEMQRDLYLDGVAFMLDSSTALLRLAGELVQNAVQPLETRAAAHR